MANYNLETETTVHVKGMSFGESSGGESSMGGGNSLVINGKNARVGDYEITADYHVMVVDTDEILFLTNDGAGFTLLDNILYLLTSMPNLGLNWNDYIGQIGYQGLDSDFIEKYETLANENSLYVDAVYMLSYDYNYTCITSKKMLPVYIACNLILSGDSRSFDELVAEVSADMETKIQWQSNAPVYIIAPRVNKEGVINLFRAVANAAQSNPSSVMSTSLFAR